ncbi:hypothetical protein ABT297_26390 [Dactylosporangium sp. NPDC000555]|uniref:hypothetical protein n=1 Tax=Dactylosporangium sp. NPDC000555 TaxID=3154260 RepID=UPI003331701D
MLREYAFLGDGRRGALLGGRGQYAVTSPDGGSPAIRTGPCCCDRSRRWTATPFAT